MNLLRSTALLIGLLGLAHPAYSGSERNSDFAVKCNFAPVSEEHGSPKIPLEWQFKASLFGIFGPGIVEVTDPKNLLDKRSITRATARGPMVFFAATRAPNYDVDGSELYVSMMKSSDTSHGLLGVISAPSQNKLNEIYSGRCLFLPIDNDGVTPYNVAKVSNDIFDTVIGNFRTELAQ